MPHLNPKGKAECLGGRGFGEELTDCYSGLLRIFAHHIPSVWNTSPGPTSSLSTQKTLWLYKQWHVIFDFNVFLFLYIYPPVLKSPIKIAINSTTCPRGVLGKEGRLWSHVGKSGQAAINGRKKDIKRGHQNWIRDRNLEPQVTSRT